MHEIAALYCRLSREDGEFGDSGSIINQKEQLTEYAKAHKMKIYKIYIDDGYSGTNFNRPGFQELLKDADLKKFNVLIVKDLSRFGRNYIHTGLYTEEYFPQRNIRVIAINDNFDTQSDDNEFAPFKNIINEWYTKDISKKIRATHRMHQQKGIIPTGKLPLYGYMYDNDRKRIIDPETAPIVKRIYEDYTSGKTLPSIVESLIKDKIKIPSYYYYEKYNYYPERFASFTEEQKYAWTRSMLEKILSKKEYTGDLYLAKSYVKSFKIKQDVINPIEKQYHFENQFPAIIDDIIFEKATKIRSANLKIKTDTPYDMYRGVIRCYTCKDKLKIRNIVYKGKKDIAFGCRNPECSCRTLIKAEDMESLIKMELQRVKGLLGNKNEFINKCKMFLEQHTYIPKVDHTNEIEELIQRNKKLDVIIEKLIEQHLEDQIPLATYERMMAKYKNEYKENAKKLDSLTMDTPNTVDYLALAKQFYKEINSIEKGLSIGKIVSIFNAIYIYKRKGQSGKVLFDYDKLRPMIEGCNNVTNEE